MADKMAECRWLKPHLVAQIEYADWTDVNRPASSSRCNAWL
jgi:ATP-dependent DNA ligase